MAFLLRVNGGNPTERLRINSTGDIGINYSGTPNATLDIRTDRDPANGVMCFLRNNTNDGNGAMYGMDINGCGTWSCGMLDNSNNFSIVKGSGNSGTEYFRVTSGGKIGIGEDDPESNHVLIRGSSTVATKSGHIMLTGDSATVGEGPQIVFAESGATTSYAGGYVGFLRQGSNSIGDLVFGTRGTTGDANTVPTERLRITSGGDTELRNSVSAINNSYSQYLKFRTTQSNGQSAITGAIRAQGKSGWGGDLVFYSKPANGSPNDSVTERLRIDTSGLVNVTGGNLHVGQDGATANFTDSNNGNTKHIEIGATGGGDALLTTHASGYGIGYFGYEAGGDRLIIACDDGGGNNTIDFVTNAGTSTGGGSDNLNGKEPKMRIKSGGGGVQIFVHEGATDFQPKHDVTALLIQNGIGGGDIGGTSEPTHIDWAWVDSNDNDRPQCRISGNVGNGGDPNSLQLEGKGFLTFHCSDTNSSSTNDIDPPQRLRIAHNGTFTGSSSNNISDQRLKENIATITDPIAKIKALKGRTFTWKSEARMREGTHYGFVAQEVETIIPDLIVDDTGIRVFDKDDNLQPSNVITPPVGGGYAKSVDADGVTPVLVEALKEALSRIETLEAEVAALKSS